MTQPGRTPHHPRQKEPVNAMSEEPDPRAAAPGARTPDVRTAREWAGLCHSLTVRVPGPVDPGRLDRNLAAGARRRPALRPLRLWHTAVAAPSGTAAAERRARAEAARPVRPDMFPVRAVLVHCSDGAADLVLVAARISVPRPALDRLAALLLDGAADAWDDAPDIPACAPFPPAPEHDPVPWGLGLPGRAGTTGTVPLPLPERAGLDVRHLVGALALALARYAAGDEGADAGVTVGRVESAALRGYDDIRAYTVRTDDEPSTADFLAQFDTAPATAPRVPAAGLIVGTAQPGRSHRPCLAPVFPLTLHAERQADGTLRGTCWFDEGTVAPQLAERFCAHVAHLAAQLAESPGARPVSHLELLTAAEHGSVLRAGSSAPVRTSGGHLVGLFEERVRSGPDAPALGDGTTQLTYRQLDDAAEEVAAGLRAKGVAPGSRVGVCLERDAGLVVTLLGVLKSGCAYVPMDVHYPQERLRYITEQAQLPVVVASAGQFPALAGVAVVAPGELRELGAAADAPGEPPHLDPGQAAYVIYTSGSTGRPKGVVVPHANVVALVDATADDFGLGPHDTWTLFHSSAFDFSVWEIWGCLLSGGRLVVVPYWTTRDTEEFHELLADERVTVLSQTPSAFSQLIRADRESARDLALRLVVFGGEPLDVRMLAPWFARHSPADCRLVNMFGITETTVHTTAHTVTPEDVVAGSRSVGRALPGWSLSVRDRHGRVLPPGPVGEIYVGGAGVASHYLGQPDLTAERFRTDPVTGQRVYRSGDKGRLRPDGSLEHLGRLDSQVKIRGHRVELDEIRAVLLKHPRVSAVALAIRQETPGDPASSRLDAYAVGSGTAQEAAPMDAADVRDILAHARRFLPDYMVPATLTPVAALPLTVNGKLDPSRLPAPLPLTPRAPATVEPSGDLTDDIIRVWSRVLNTEVRLGDNFFELGGNSLLVVRLLAELRASGLPRVSSRQFYHHSTAGQFVQLLRTLIPA